MKTIGFVAIYVVLLCLPVSANATAIFQANIEDWFTSDVPHPGWKYHITTSKPANPEACLANGSTVQENSSKDGPVPITVVTLGPPFSGSAVRRRWVTVCIRSDQFIIVQMAIHLNGCVAWVCSGDWTFVVEETQGSPTLKECSGAPSGCPASGYYDVEKRTIWPDNVDILVPHS